MPSLSLNSKYIKGKQTMCLIAIITTILGFVLDAITYYRIYSPIQVLVQGASVFACSVALVLYVRSSDRYYITAFGIISYLVIINIFITAIIIHTFLSFEKFSEANILSRDILFILFYISLSGFILGRKHIIIQTLMLYSLVLYFILIKQDEFFKANAAIYIISIVGFTFAIYFFVGTLNNLIKGLKKANARANRLKHSEKTKNEILLNYQNSLLQLTKEESLYKKSLDYVFDKICAVAERNLSVSRVSIWTMEVGNSRIVRRHLNESQVVTSEEVILERTDFPRYFKALESSPFIIANNASEHPDTREFKDGYLTPLSIVSMLDCPIIIDGKPMGVICCEHQQIVKNWRTEDVLFLQSLAEHISLCYKNLEINDLLTQVRLTNNELLEKSNEIETMNEELNSVNEELFTINENLEATVKNRTIELETQNKQLTEYAFINSHILRAPLARILGLAQLISCEALSVKDEELVKALIHSSNELDIIIRKISDLLYDGNNLSREDIQAIIDKKFSKT